MSKLLSQEELAELVIYADNIHDILNQYEFNYNLKMEFRKIEKSVKAITKFTFGQSSIGELDDWKISIRDFTQELIKDNVHLKESK